MRNVKLTLALITWMITEIANAQVKQNLIVEHFTNSNCSVCASRNPGFYSNLNQNTDIRHIAYHPSSPYASCFFSMQNKTENDDRTKYYGVFGSTPRLVIQGTVISNIANYSSSSIFDPFLAKTTPIQIGLTLQAKGTDSLTIRVVLTTKANHTLGGLRLFAAIVEKEIAFAAPNGESVHHDVFRKSVFEANGMPLTLSNITGDSVIYTATVFKRSEWVASQLYAVAILNKESDKSLVQTEQSKFLNSTSGISKMNVSAFEVFPNPARDVVHINFYKKVKLEVKVLDITGQVVIKENDFEGGEIEISQLPSGVYFIQMGNNDQWISKKFIKQ